MSLFFALILIVTIAAIVYLVYRHQYKRGFDDGYNHGLQVGQHLTMDNDDPWELW